MSNIILLILLFSLPISLYSVICYEYSFHVNNYKLKHTKYINEQDMKDDLDKVNNYKRKLSISSFLTALLVSIPFTVSYFLAKNYIVATICLVYVIAVVIAKITKHEKICNIFAKILIVPVILYFIVMSFFLYHNLTYNPCKLSKEAFDEIEVTTFNAKFTQYEGKVTGTTVKTLIRNITSNNSNPDNIDKIISVEFLDSSGNPWADVSFDKTKLNGYSNIKNNAKFDVNFEYHNTLNKNDPQKGLIEKVIIKQIDATPTPTPEETEKIEETESSEKAEETEKADI